MLESEYLRPRRLPPHLRKRPEPEAPFSFSIRPATPEDIPHIREIYNHYVLNSMVTFDEKVTTLKTWRAKFANAAKLKHPILVAVSPTGQVLGYAMVAPWRPRSGYRFTVEDAIYLRPASTGKGLGPPLLKALIEACREAGLRTMIAVIADSGADASLRLHEQLGFVEVGRMGGVGYKFGRTLGTVTLQLALKPSRPQKLPETELQKPESRGWRRWFGAGA